jgi:chorismate mutase
MPKTVPHPFLAEQRQKIDEIDRRLVSLLAQRFAVTTAVGEYKATHGLPSRDPTREQDQDRELRAWAAAAGLGPDLASGVLRLILDEVVRAHDVRKGKTA